MKEKIKASVKVHGVRFIWTIITILMTFGIISTILGLWLSSKQISTESAKSVITELIKGNITGGWTKFLAIGGIISITIATLLFFPTVMFSFISITNNLKRLEITLKKQEEFNQKQRDDHMEKTAQILQKSMSMEKHVTNTPKRPKPNKYEDIDPSDIR